MKILFTAQDGHIPSAAHSRLCDAFEDAVDYAGFSELLSYFNSSSNPPDVIYIDFAQTYNVNEAISLIDMLNTASTCVFAENCHKLEIKAYASKRGVLNVEANEDSRQKALEAIAQTYC